MVLAKLGPGAFTSNLTLLFKKLLNHRPVPIQLLFVNSPCPVDEIEGSLGGLDVDVSSHFHPDRNRKYNTERLSYQVMTVAMDPAVLNANLTQGRLRTFIQRRRYQGIPTIREHVETRVELWEFNCESLLMCYIPSRRTDEISGKKGPSNEKNGLERESVFQKILC